ncbi:MAG: bifunctional riboflavin kinase/FAD synthetase [Chloroflexi bacterium]|nr:bifunctional riboflavin kinase/FAD synthetase [Chloroflexota bacterium]
MNFRQRLNLVSPERETVLTIGVFDGVHRGHSHLLQRLISLARPDFQPAVLTFSNHPVTVLQPQRQVSFLTTSDEKERLLRSEGIELVVSLEFTEELAQLSAREFVSLLVDSLNMKGLVVGPDFALGRNREGTTGRLAELGQEMGFFVYVSEPLLLEETLVKSRVIRQKISEGDVATTRRLLGREYSLTGQVITGDRRGRQLGFPTANVDVSKAMAHPADGIYATWAVVDGVRRPSATSIGVRPTFGLTERLVEVYILDFDGDLYGQDLEVQFVEKLRDQETFTSLEALVEQINLDVANTRETLAIAGGANGP